MKKIYLLLLFIGVFSLSNSGVNAQSTLSISQGQKEKINIYPNPVKGNTLYITSKSGKSKTVTAYNVLGEKVLFEVVTNEELDISSLQAGVYILRIKIGEENFSKKLIRN